MFPLTGRRLTRSVWQRKRKFMQNLLGLRMAAWWTPFIYFKIVWRNLVQGVTLFQGFFNVCYSERWDGWTHSTMIGTFGKKVRNVYECVRDWLSKIKKIGLARYDTGDVSFHPLIEMISRDNLFPRKRSQRCSVWLNIFSILHSANFCHTTSITQYVVRYSITCAQPSKIDWNSSLIRQYEFGKCTLRVKKKYISFWQRIFDYVDDNVFLNSFPGYTF